MWGASFCLDDVFHLATRPVMGTHPNVEMNKAHADPDLTSGI